MEKGPLFSESFYEDAHENLNKIEVSSGRLDLSFVKVLIDDLYRSYRKVNLPYRILHGDFSSANIFVTCDGKICAVDPHNEPAPLYLDLAKIITDLETRRIQILTNGMSVPRSRLKIFNSSLLNGYFSADPVNYFALNLFRLLLLIEKWAENEAKLQQIRGKSRFLYSLGVSQMRRYLLSLLHKQVYEQDYGL